MLQEKSCQESYIQQSEWKWGHYYIPNRDKKRLESNGMNSSMPTNSDNSDETDMFLERHRG